MTEKNDEVDNALKGLGLWCLTPLSTIFQLYRGGNALINSEKLLVLYVKMLIFHLYHGENKLHAIKRMPACTRPTQKPEKQQIPIVVFSFEPATARTYDLHIQMKYMLNWRKITITHSHTCIKDISFSYDNVAITKWPINMYKYRLQTLYEQAYKQ
jgi:hypothetical protein